MGTSHQLIPQGYVKVDWIWKDCVNEKWGAGPDAQDCDADGIEAFPTIRLYRTMSEPLGGFPTPVKLADGSMSNESERMLMDEYVDARDHQSLFQYAKVKAMIPQVTTQASMRTSSM